MSAKTPMFCCAMTVTGSAVIKTSWGSITIPEGVYWTDPIYSGMAKAADVTCLLAQLAHQLQADLSDAGTYTVSYDKDTGSVSGDTNSVYGTALSVSGSTLQLLPQDAVTTAMGRRILARLGYSQVAVTPSSAGTSIPSGGFMAGVWTSPRPESTDIDERADTFNARIRTYGGRVYSVNFGEELRRRVVTLPAIPSKMARTARGNIDYANFLTQSYPDNDRSLEFQLGPAYRDGELVRYYADVSAAATYLTSDLSASASSMTVASTAQFDTAATQLLYVDGEEIGYTGSTGTTFTGLIRNNPKAHSKYAPVCEDFVATYSLSESDGNVNLAEFAPRRRAPNQDRWDFEIPLERAS